MILPILSMVPGSVWRRGRPHLDGPVDRLGQLEQGGQVVLVMCAQTARRVRSAILNRSVVVSMMSPTAMFRSSTVPSYLAAPRRAPSWVRFGLLVDDVVRLGADLFDLLFRQQPRPERLLRPGHGDEFISTACSIPAAAPRKWPCDERLVWRCRSPRLSLSREMAVTSSLSFRPGPCTRRPRAVGRP